MQCHSSGATKGGSAHVRHTHTQTHTHGKGWPCVCRLSCWWGQDDVFRRLGRHQWSFKTHFENWPQFFLNSALILQEWGGVKRQSDCIYSGKSLKNIIISCKRRKNFSQNLLPLLDWVSWLGSGTLVCAVSNNSYVWSSSSSSSGSPRSSMLLLVYRAYRKREKRQGESKEGKMVRRKKCRTDDSKGNLENVFVIRNFLNVTLTNASSVVSHSWGQACSPIVFTPFHLHFSSFYTPTAPIQNRAQMNIY